MTLGQLIESLGFYPESQPVALGFGNPHAYSLRYTEVAFEVLPNTTVGAMLADARSAVGVAYPPMFEPVGLHTRVNIVRHAHGEGEELGEITLALLLGEAP